MLESTSNHEDSSDFSEGGFDGKLRCWRFDFKCPGGPKMIPVETVDLGVMHKV